MEIDKYELVKSTIASMSRSKGMYGRLLESFNEKEAKYGEDFKNEVREAFKDCHDAVDVVMEIEC